MNQFHENRKAESGREKIRLFVVNDEPQYFSFLQKHFEDQGNYHVRIEKRSQQAFRSAIAFSPHVILLDTSLLGTSGAELVLQIKTHPKLKYVPIGFLTAVLPHGESPDEDMTIDGIPCLSKSAGVLELVCFVQKLLCDSNGHTRAA